MNQEASHYTLVFLDLDFPTLFISSLPLELVLFGADLFLLSVAICEHFSLPSDFFPVLALSSSFVSSSSTTGSATLDLLFWVIP